MARPRAFRSWAAWLGLPPHGAPYDPQSRWVTSYVLPPAWLAGVRLLLGLYAFVSIIINYSFNGWEQFAYFTVLSYWGVVAWFVASGLHTAAYALALRRWKQQAAGPAKASAAAVPRSWLAQRFPRPLQFLHSLLFSTICTFPLLVLVVYWAVLAGSAFASVRSTWQNLTVHALNYVFVFLDFAVLGRGPMMPWSHMLFCVIILALYLGVAYIHYANVGIYVYDFLDPGEVGGQGPLAGVAIGIGVGTCIAFLAGQACLWLREVLAAKLQRSGAWGSAKPVGVPDEALLPTDVGPGPDGEGSPRPVAGAAPDAAPSAHDAAWTPPHVPVSASTSA